MRFIILVTLFITTNLSIFAQDLFKTGLKYYDEGKYSKADSVFGILMEKSPADINLLYNYGTTRLYMGDTCKFCETMLALCHSFQEKDACDLYFKICGTIDTLFFDKKFLKCGRKDTRYYETIETHKNEDYKTVYIHDKKEKGMSILAAADFMNPRKTDIIAWYKLFADSSRLFLFTTTHPVFQNGDSDYDFYIHNNLYIKECKEKLKLKKVVVGVEYVIGKTGNIRDIKITSITTPNDHIENRKNITQLYKKTTVDDMNTLKQYIDLIVAGMPQMIPGKYRDENVDYLVTSTIAFW